VEEKKINKITEGVIWKALIMFFLPIFLQSVFQQVFGIVDAVIVGQGVGKHALGAINSTSNLTKLFLNLFLGFCSGAAIIVGQGWGAKDKVKIEKAVHTGTAFSLLGGVVTAIICVPLSPIFMNIMRIPSDMMEYSLIYTQIIFISFIGMFIYDMAAAILRAIGDSKRPFYYLIVAMVLNLLLDMLFVLVFKWGVAGAAVATAIAQMVAAALGIIRLCRLRSDARVFIHKIRFHKDVLVEMIKLGVPMGISGILYSISNIAIQSSINSLGTDVITGWSVHVKVSSVIWSIFDAFAISASTFVAQNFGAGRPDRVHGSIRSTLGVGAIVTLSVSVILYVFIQPLSYIFISDSVVIDYAIYIERTMAPFYIFYLFGEVFGSSIRGTGETFKPMLITLIGTCGFRIAWVAAGNIFGLLNVTFMAVGYPVSWAFNSALMAILFFFGGWRKKIRVKE